MPSSPSTASEGYGPTGTGLSKPVHELPPPHQTQHVLYFRLARSKIFRTIIVPSNYNFHLIHRLIQYTFGWSDSHLHKFDIHVGCELYKSQPKKTWIKEWGKRIHTILNKHCDFGESFEGPGFEKGETAVTVGNVWRKEAHWASGERIIGVQYEYDFGDSWHVEITCTGQKTLKTPSNLAQITKAKGGPPTEEWNPDDCESEGDQESKEVNIQRFNDSWARYLKGELWTKTRLYDVAIFEMDEQDDEDRQGSEEDEDDVSGENDSEEVAEEASTGEERSANKRAAPEDSAIEDSTKRARHE
ncbi:MAG: hypothetical protein Q9195_002346 [Heterodermia aff. obscurata]